MSVIKTKNNNIYIEESEIKPNTYAFSVLVAITIIMTIVCLLNEINIFQISHNFVRLCLFISVLFCIGIGIIINNKKLVRAPSSKYIIMIIIIFLVLTMTIILNINAVLAYTLPLLLAAQYRSMNISRIALIGSCFCCIISPILSYLWGTWNLNFMKGYIQVFCNVTIDVIPGNNITVLDSIKQISLYWSIPQTMIICAFGFILYSSTKSGIKSVHNQIQVANLSDDLTKQTKSITVIQEKILYAMSDIIESRDFETGGHVRRTSEIVKLFMNEMIKDPLSGITEDFLHRVVNSAPMHDLGKIAISDTILRKYDKLTLDEIEILKRHPLESAKIITQALTGVEDEELLKIAINIAKYHHERYDGTGYPEHLKGKEIPLEARIMAIADVYDALVSKRYYKNPIPFNEAFDIIINNMGTQFDPDLNKYFITCRKEIEKFYNKDEDLKKEKL